MGRGGKRGGGRGGGRGNKAPAYDSRQGTQSYASWHDGDKANAKFEEFYKAQNIVPEDEWAPFIKALQTELPATFRVTGSRAHAETINSLIKETYMPLLKDVVLDGVAVDPPFQLPWYPAELAWQLNAPKRVIRKSPNFKVFQRFLVGETEVGNLSRQEAVSMIPPLLLDVQPQHYCLDLCAAPGSKTAQIIEALNPHSTTDESTGFLIANDADYKRTHMLVHQTGRMPSLGLAVTNLDASQFPSIKLAGQSSPLGFDRILADVPCSGDGTMRKNAEIWNKWNCTDGNSLHGLQLRIILRAMAMLKPGGRLVYSTCSFNPVENEAVVAAALNANPGQYTLLDQSSALPNLKRRPGISTWKIATQAAREEDGTRPIVWHDSYEAYAAQQTEDEKRDKGKSLPETAWAPANAAELGLEKCLRLLPHDQDTGGFFVCVFEKKEDAPGPTATAVATPEETTPVPEAAPAAEPVSAEAATEESSTESTTGTKRALSPSAPESEEAAKKPRQILQQKQKKRDPSWKEDPFSYVDASSEEIQSCVDFYKIGSNFSRSRMLVRNENGTPLRTMYMSNEILKQIIENNDWSRLRLVSAGVKAFVRQDGHSSVEKECKWRIPAEGILGLLPHMDPSVIAHATVKDLRLLLSELYPVVESFDEPFRSVCQNAKSGCLVVRVAEGEEAGGKLALPLFLPLWKAKASMSLMIDKREKSTLSLRTFGEDICAVPVKKAAPATAAEPETPGSEAVAAAPAVAALEEAASVVDEEAAMND